MKRLIVTADDVGLHPGMTAGALQAHRDGIVTACSVVANGAAFPAAVEKLLDTPTLAVGVHLALVDGKPLSQSALSLTAPDGRFFRNYSAFVPRYFARLIRMSDVERELRAQIETVMRAGLTITHANGHQHLHLLPRILAVVHRLAAEYRIGYVRIVDDRGGRASFSRRAAIEALSALGRRARRRSTVRTNAHTIGISEAGHLTIDSLLRLISSADGVTELVTHPGLDDRALSDAYRWGYAWEAETNALCDPRVRAAIADSSAELITPAQA